MRRRRLLRSLAAGTLVPLPGLSLAQAGYDLRPWSGPVPVLNQRDIHGRAWTLEALRGTAVLVNFWATWCEPCRAEMPSLERLGGRHAPQDLQVLAVNFKESAQTVQRFLQRTPLALPVLLDEDGSATRAWGVRIFPSTVLVGRNGRPAAVVVGEMDWDGEAARHLVEPLLARSVRT